MLRTVPLFGTGSPNRVPHVTGQKRTNMCLRPSKDGEKGGFYITVTPGMTEVVATASLGSTPSRGAISVNNVIYSVHGNTLYSINSSFTVTSRGTINTSSGHVSMAWNGTQICIVDGTDGWTYTTATNTLAEITDGQFPTAASTVCFIAGRFVVSQASTGRFHWSALLDGTAWDALDFATAESETDNLVGVATDHGSLVLLGDISTEFWGSNPSASSSADSYVRIGGAGLEWGCASVRTVQQFDTGLIFLARNRLGECRVVRLNGYTAVPVDDEEIAYAINEVSSLSSATAFSYVMDGQSFYQLNLSSTVSLLYDGIGWSFVTSYNGTARHPGNIRAALSQLPYVFHYSTGAMYLLDKDVLTAEAGTGSAVVREVISKHIFTDGEPSTIWKLNLHCAGNVSYDNENNVVELKVSKDGGATYSSGLDATIGALTTPTHTRVLWRRLGRARDWVFKFSTDERFRWTITGGSVELE